MKKVVLVIIGVCVLVGLAYAAFELSSKDKHYSWRYKITVEIDTPEGIKSGSAVREVRALKNNRELNPQFPAVEYEVIGEAVVIDLAERGILFALIDWDSYKEVFNAFPTEARSAVDRLNYYKNLEIGQRAPLKLNYPRIIKFDDIDDVTSIKLVYKNYANGDVLIDNFEDVVGSGVHLHKIEIQITNEEITSKIKEFLPARHAVGPYEFIRKAQKWQ